MYKKTRYILGGVVAAALSLGIMTPCAWADTHVHNWTSEVKTVHHEAQYETVEHPAYYGVWNTCNAHNSSVFACGFAGFDEIHQNWPTSYTPDGTSTNMGQTYQVQTLRVVNSYSELVEVVAEHDSAQIVYTCSGCGETKSIDIDDINHVHTPKAVRSILHLYHEATVWGGGGTPFEYDDDETVFQGYVCSECGEALRYAAAATPEHNKYFGDYMVPISDEEGRKLIEQINKDAGF